MNFILSRYLFLSAVRKAITSRPNRLVATHTSHRTRSTSSRLYHFCTHTVVMAGEIGEGLAAGTEDLSALAGVLCTEGVEQNVLALHYGYSTVCISSFSHLGILGLVRTSVKLALGREGCGAAGFGTDNLRPLYGYDVSEKDSDSTIVDCDRIKVVFGRDTVRISKSKRYLSSDPTPMVGVGSKYDPGLSGITAVNLGNYEREGRLGQHPILRILWAVLCPGFTCWTLCIITVKRWDWVFFVAVPVFHFCLISMLAIPLWYQWQTDRPGQLASPRRWDLLNGHVKKTHPAKGFIHTCPTLDLIQARVNHGDVLHFQGDTSFLDSWWLKA